ncbi:MAG: hypothetical protein NTW21_40505 [Verrucomicrobia bacterium]|nr:hypothetical protein [Verrucomicrobiota bacterium]
MRSTTAIIGTGLALACFLLGSAGFFLVSALFGPAFGGLYRMFMYHEEYPLPYIAVVAIVFGIVGTFWLRAFGHTKGWTRWVSIFATIVLTIAVASIPGGILWKIHDMQAGYFPHGARFWKDLLWGAKEGLMVGWIVIATSIPYNVFGIAFGVLILHRLPGIAARIERQEDEQVVAPNGS